MTAQIRCQDLTVVYGAVKALDGLTLDIRSGETVLVTGPSGGGKSTFLRALCGLLGEDAKVKGAVRIDDADPLAGAPDLPRTVGYVPQNPAHALFCTTVRDEVMAGPRHLRLDDPAGRGERALAALGCADLAARHVRELSSGQQQRVAIAAALAAGPEAILMDEPTSYLDAGGLRHLRESLQALRSRGVTVVVVEHRLDRLPEGFDRIVRIEAGRIATGAVWSTPEPPTLASPESRLGPPVVRMQGVGVAFGGRTILDGVDLEVREGERLALVGENGAGKSTLGRVLAGLLKPSRGQVVTADGRKVVPGVDVGLAPPNPTEALFCDTVEEELAYGPANFRRAAATADLIAAMRLSGLERRRPHRLSLGQQQRVSTAAALAVRPKLIVLDEPTIGQDLESLRGLFASLAALSREGVATMLITHDVAMARAFAPRVLRLEGGKLIS